MTVTGPDGTPLTQVAAPVRLGPQQVPHHAALPGAHNDEILAPLGLTPTATNEHDKGAENP